VTPILVLNSLEQSESRRRGLFARRRNSEMDDDSRSGKILRGRFGIAFVPF
jgi:hypothetical protein